MPPVNIGMKTGIRNRLELTLGDVLVELIASFCLTYLILIFCTLHEPPIRMIKKNFMIFICFILFSTM